MTYWALPVLENVVMQGAARADTLQALWEMFGGQVRILELEVGSGVLMGDVGSIVRVCPALEELNLGLGVEDSNLCSNSTADSEGGVTRTWVCTHNTLQRVGICTDAGKWSVKTWMAVAEYVGKLGKGCPALRQIALYVPDDIEVAEQDSRFNALRETMSSRGKQLLLRSFHV